MIIRLFLYGGDKRGKRSLVLKKLRHFISHREIKNKIKLIMIIIKRRRIHSKLLKPFSRSLTVIVSKKVIKSMIIGH